MFLSAATTVLVVACGNSACVARVKSAGPGDSLGGSGLTMKSGSRAKANEAKAPAARIKPDWQKFFVNRAKELKATEAWGLFSEGGWVDDGQTMIFALPEGTAAVEVVMPGGRAADSLRPMTASDMILWRKDTSGLDSLEDFVEPAYDAIQYEAVHLIPLIPAASAPSVGNGSVLDVKTRIMIVRATTDRSRKHFDLLSAFKAVRHARVDH